mgnify:CR=1 FL=1
MFYWLTELSDKISFFNVFRYITFRTGGAIVTAAGFRIPVWRAHHRSAAAQAGQGPADLAATARSRTSGHQRAARPRWAA